MKNNLWIKCQNCSSPIFGKIFEENFKVCDKCNYHHKLNFNERLKLLIDPKTFQEIDKDISPLDPLNFGEDYLEKLKKDQEKSNLKDALITGLALIGNHPVILGIMDFNFRGGSMGSVV
ncbi:MAG: acetyl-CoA carboxylase carboxyl transferase subunit beta, partial [Armatimonadetes bacterium]|nr:acetyl-CoA carboxylase carboxyl transferase subunit beta [Armatimonadota bacterium]